jgi:molybdopterin adenylyltransferase
MDAPHHHPHEEHRAAAPVSISCMVITCSDTRTPDTDTSGAAITTLLQEHRHRVAQYHVVKDDSDALTSLIHQGASDPAVQAIIINGGTGISRRDSTFETVDKLLEKRLDGFGEIFRYLSFKEIGAAAIMSRATAGLYRNRILISVPGSEHAVRLAMNRLVLPELGHMIREMTK